MGCHPLAERRGKKFVAGALLNMMELVTKEGDEAQLLQQCDGKVVLVHSLDQLRKKSKEGIDMRLTQS